MSDTELRERGLAIRKQPWPDEDGGITFFRALNPDFSDFIITHGYGAIYGNPTRDLRTRSLFTCAVLAVMGRQRGIEVSFSRSPEYWYPRWGSDSRGRTR